MTLDPFRNDHELQRRTKPRGDGFLLSSFHLFGVLSFLLICALVSIPMVSLAFRAFTERQPPEKNIPGDIKDAHSLGINPQDGRVYAATSHGLYIVTGLYEAERVGGSYQQNSGFTIVGPDRFISSGRPDFRDIISGFAPDKAGFQLSTDAGHSWRSLSLKAQGSFSALDVVGGEIYGYESVSGSFMISRDDGRRWETLSTPPVLIDFAVSPADARTIIGLTESGMLRSRDGGLTWQEQAAPGLTLIDWLVQPQLWGLDEAGKVLLSEDGGATWETRGSLSGTPEALLAASDGIYAFVHGTGIFASEDGGRTWVARYLLPVPFDQDD